MAVVERLQHAMNAHDLDAFVACLSPDYASTFPAHPDRTFRGREQARENWAQIFAAIPDIQATLLGCVQEGETVWTEWEWTGTWINDAPYRSAGVVIMGVRDEHVAWSRLYAEPVEPGGGRQTTGNPAA
jgi:hypothetical protein